MYQPGRGQGPLTSVVVTAASAVILPNTGSNNMIVNLAISVAAGLIVWGALYARNAHNAR